MDEQKLGFIVDDEPIVEFDSLGDEPIEELILEEARTGDQHAFNNW